MNILAGFVAGNFSAFWMGLCIAALMVCAWLLATFNGSPILALLPDQFKFAAPIFAFGLVAFGFLAMAPVIIAVDSFGPVTDNAQSVYELSRIESLPNIGAEIERDFHFTPNFGLARCQRAVSVERVRREPDVKAHLVDVQAHPTTQQPTRLTG